MTSVNGIAGPNRPRIRNARARHDEAITQAEVRRLARAFEPFRVLRRDAREHAAGAKHWQEGGLDRSLSAAVREGVIEPVPLGLYRMGDEPAARQTGR